MAFAEIHRIVVYTIEWDRFYRLLMHSEEGAFLELEMAPLLFESNFSGFSDEHFLVLAFVPYIRGLI